MKPIGVFIQYESGKEEQAKEYLKAELHKYIDKLCEDESFWIKSDGEVYRMLGGTGNPTIGWKLLIPQTDN